MSVPQSISQECFDMIDYKVHIMNIKQLIIFECHYYSRLNSEMNCKPQIVRQNRVNFKCCDVTSSVIVLEQNS